MVQWGAVRVLAIVLAAGEGRRMGGPKALLRLDETTFLARVCRLLARPGLSSVIAVLGAEAERVRAEAGLPGDVKVVVNKRWPEGMLTSVWAGLDAADSAGADAALLHPVDNPFVEPATIDAVLAALAGGAEIAVPSHAGHRGHPAGFARATFSALRAAPIDRGARAVLARDPARVVHVPAGADCLVDLDRPEDLVRARSRLPGKEETP